MTPQKLQELKAKLAKLSPAEQQRVKKAVRASMDVQQHKARMANKPKPSA